MKKKTQKMYKSYATILKKKIYEQQTDMTQSQK